MLLVASAASLITVSVSCSVAENSHCYPNQKSHAKPGRTISNQWSVVSGQWSVVSNCWLTDGCGFLTMKWSNRIAQGFSPGVDKSEDRPESGDRVGPFLPA